MRGKGNFEIGRILHCKSEILKSQIGQRTSLEIAIQETSFVQFEISDFGFEMQDSSDFKLSLLKPLGTDSCAPTN